MDVTIMMKNKNANTKSGNDDVSEIQDYIAQEKSSMKEEDQPFMTVSIKADKETKMGLITDVKQALREAYALKISYSARQAAD